MTATLGQANRARRQCQGRAVADATLVQGLNGVAPDRAAHDIGGSTLRSCPMGSR